MADLNVSMEDGRGLVMGEMPGQLNPASTIVFVSSEPSLWRCPKGHEVTTSGTPMVLDIYGGSDNRKLGESGPLCPFCYIDWVVANVSPMAKETE